MATIIIIIISTIFAIGAKVSLENQKGELDRLLKFGIPKSLIILLFFVFAPWVVWNGCKWCVWRVKVWRAMRRLKQIVKLISKKHKDNPELQKSLNEFSDLIDRF